MYATAATDLGVILVSALLLRGQVPFVVPVVVSLITLTFAGGALAHRGGGFGSLRPIAGGLSTAGLLVGGGWALAVLTGVVAAEGGPTLNNAGGAILAGFFLVFLPSAPLMLIGAVVWSVVIDFRGQRPPAFLDGTALSGIKAPSPDPGPLPAALQTDFTRRTYVRVGVASSALWIALALIESSVIQLGSDAMTGPLLGVDAIVALLVLGRYWRLSTWADWIRATVIGVVLDILIVIVALV